MLYTYPTEITNEIAIQAHFVNAAINGDYDGMVAITRDTDFFPTDDLKSAITEEVHDTQKRQTALNIIATCLPSTHNH